MFPPEVERFFAQERLKQTYIATAQKNLRETTVVMHHIIEKVGQRGVVVEECETQSEELLESSEAFYMANLPAWKRWMYTLKAPWWWKKCFCFCYQSKKKMGLN